VRVAENSEVLPEAAVAAAFTNSPAESAVAKVKKALPLSSHSSRPGKSRPLKLLEMVFATVPPTKLPGVFAAAPVYGAPGSVPMKLPSTVVEALFITTLCCRSG
jgi:hypothetical protein